MSSSKQLDPKVSSSLQLFFLGLQSGPCAIEDFKCVSEATESFREKLAYGNAAFDIKPYDPFIIDVVNSNLIDGTLAQFKNINVTGLRKQKITELK